MTAGRKKLTLDHFDLRLDHVGIYGKHQVSVDKLIEVNLFDEVFAANRAVTLLQEFSTV